MKKRYVKIMFLSMALLVISTAATYAVQPKDEPKETVQTPTDEHLPSLTINGTNESSFTHSADNLFFITSISTSSNSASLIIVFSLS